jgi:hypothetical protein
VSRAPEIPTELTHRRVAELTRAGLGPTLAIRSVAEREGRKEGTIANAYYVTRRQLLAEAGAPAAPRGRPKAKTNGDAGSEAEKAAVRPRVARTPRPSPAPALSLADELQALADALAALAPKLIELQRDALRWRGVREFLDLEE